jgi:hypothetical protein
MRGQYAELVRVHHLERLKAADTDVSAERGPAAGMLFPFDLTRFDRGRPYYWQSVTGTAAPRLSLVAQSTSRKRQALVWSTLLLGLLLALGVVAHYFQAAWPEQLALLGGLGGLLFGPGLGTAFLLLPLGWVCYRLVVVGRWLSETLRAKWATPVAEGIQEPLLDKGPAHP